MEKVYIISAIRTPIGSFGGSLSSLTAVQLGANAIKAAINKANIKGDQVDEVFMGNVISANLGQAPAKQAALDAGIPDSVPCTTINKVCSSGMKSIMFAAQSIQLGHGDIQVAGGMESMSNVPYYVPKARFGYKFGDASLIDGLSRDGLIDPYEGIAMGVCADRTAEKYDISREQQDQYAKSSYQRSADTTAASIFKDEITPIEITDRKGNKTIIDSDEEFGRVNFDKISKLRPAFSPDGTVTAANASTLNDGASALVLASERAVKKYGLKPLARIVSYADASQEPQWFTTTPTIAAPMALKRAKLEWKDVDFIEVNEAFSVVALAFNKILNLDHDKVNVHGGSVSLGHPLGASGARIVTTLQNVLHHKDANIGLAAICNGGGGASAMVLERV